MNPAAQTADAPSTQQRRLALILFNVCVGQFIVGLDQRALLVALPTLTPTFNTSLTTIQWVLLIYDLLLIGTVITVGRLGDLFGRRRFYASGFLIFVLSSALCGIAQTAAQIILFRGLQAIGGAMISANGRAIASVAFPASQRGKAMGFASMAFHVGFLNRTDLGRFLDRHDRLALDFLHQSTDRDLGRVSGVEDCWRKAKKRSKASRSISPGRSSSC